MKGLLRVGLLAMFALAACNRDSGIIIDPVIQPEDTAPSWSPDGTQIAYIHFNPDSRDTLEPSGLYVTDAAGTITRLILSGFPRSLDWSPDGRALVVSDGSGLHLITATGDSLRSLHIGGSFPSWSPDGARIAFSAGGTIWLVDTLGNGLADIDISVPGEKRDPDWAPDGKRLVILLAPSGTSGEEIYTVRTDGNDLSRLTTDANEDRSPAWSPADTLIVWNRWGLGPQGKVHPELWAMDTLGSQQRRIFSTLSAPSFNPSGTSIVFSTQTSGSIRLFVVNLDGTGLRQLTH